MGGQRQSLPLYPRKKDAVATVQNGGWVQRSCAQRDFFVFSCTLYFIPTCFFVQSFLVLTFVFTYNTQHKHPYPWRDSFIFSVLYLYFFVLTVLALPFFSYRTTHIYTPRGIRNRNPSKRSAAEPRLRPLVHWDRLLWSMDRQTHCESL
jgi:heme/copper-type cytochrome/quinol oxidase subunit 2